jgi:predicted DNA binding CopG/RHH family protein
MKAVQYFSDDYLDQCRAMSTDQILRYLDDFRRLHAATPAVSKLISLKVPEDLLSAFKAKARLTGTPYQTQIKALMKAWVVNQEMPQVTRNDDGLESSGIRRRQNVAFPTGSRSP